MSFREALDRLEGTHDLRLPAWGPYTKRYVGISHIPDPRAGMRFDLSVFPGLYRRGVRPPNVTWESDYHPWEAAPDLSFIRHRHEVIWKDQVYADIDFCRLEEDADGSGVLVRVACVNATDNPQNLALHWMASVHFPPRGGRGEGTLATARVILPEGGSWTDGLDYAALSLGHEAHRTNLSYDGLTRGEVRVDGFVRGLGLGKGFGLTEGDAVTYRVALPRAIRDPALVLRYRMPEGSRTRLALSGPFTRRFVLRGTGDIAVREVPLLAMGAGETIVTLQPMSNDVPIEIDGFAIVAARRLPEVSFEVVPWQYAPERLPVPCEESLVLRYPQLATVYGLRWGAAADEAIPFRVREFICDDLDTTLQIHAHEHVRDILVGPGQGHYTNVFQRPIFLGPHSERVVTGLLYGSHTGDVDAVSARLATFDPADAAWDAVHAAARSRATGPGGPLGTPNPAGVRYLESQTRMAATVATNVVYPVRTRGTWIRHYTPGRWWDSLYTWDSGFIGLGLAELDLDRALDNLNAYVTAPGTADAAFIHHGSLVPTQFYVFLEMWNRTQDRDLLSYFYPRLQQYHRFLAGRLGSSTTRTLKSNLIRTWDYFYNSGGWDDYPPQFHVHRLGLQAHVTPVISTAQVIRTARIMWSAAEALGEPVAEYDEDIGLLGMALQTYAWDEEAGYFSYVVHDDNGAPAGVLRHESGANFNMGMDGASPLVAGICSPEQEARLVAALMSDTHMWSPCGLSTVDRAAPYYRDDGYWNGAVWMAHQWFFWRALLDMGRADDAHRIAVTALDVWQQEVARSYNCFEHFIVRSARGAGWHHFGGLSAPVLNWFGAYHRPGRLTGGFDLWVEALTVSPDGAGLTAQLRHTGPAHHAPVVIATLTPGTYDVRWDGAPVAAVERYPGTLEIVLPAGPWRGALRIGRKAGA